jgi:hypothetical protein
MFLLTSKKAVAVVSIMASLELNVLGAGEIKSHPEVETLPVAGDGRIGLMWRALNRRTRR